MEAIERYPVEHHLKDGSPVTLRPLRQDDEEGLVRLFERVRESDLRVMRLDVRDPALLRNYVRDLDYARVLPIVAERDGELLGEASLHRHPGTAHAHIAQLRLYVRADMRQKGLGGLLLDEVIELGGRLGLEQLVGELYLDNAALVSAFVRRGFVRDTILPVYQIVVMRYDLSAARGDATHTIDHADQLPPRRYWPEFRFDEELFPIEERFNLAELLLDRNLERGWGHRPAIYYRDEIVSYDLLHNEVQRLAGGLASLGVGAGDPVLLHLPNTPQAIAANLAVQRLGALSVPTIRQLAPEELRHILQESGAVAAITSQGGVEVVETSRAAEGVALGPVIVLGLGEDDPERQRYSYARLVARSVVELPPVLRRRDEIGLLLYTSSPDSGRPRGTAHRLDSLLAAIDSYGRHVWRVNEEDIVGMLAPLGFAQGFITSGLLPLRFGASVALPTDSMAQDGAALLDTIQRHRVTLVLASPSNYRELLADEQLDEFDIASVRLCSSHGEMLTRESYERWVERFGQPIFEGFGTTELLYAFLSNAVGMAPRPGSIGRVVPGYEVRVVGELGNELPASEIGQLKVRGPSGTLYWNDPAAQEKTIRNGWNLLNDYAYVDHEGYFWFVARSDDLIKSRSYRIDPIEVERALGGLASVEEAAVIGLPDPMRGQRPVAFVVLVAGHESSAALLTQLRADLQGRLADYKIPEEIVVVDRLPKDGEGRLQRHILRERVRLQSEE